MLTDKDKCDLLLYVSNRMQEAESDMARKNLAIKSGQKIIRFLIDHPDICAAEIDDFLGMETECLYKEIDRLHSKGMI